MDEFTAIELAHMVSGLKNLLSVERRIIPMLPAAPRPFLEDKGGEQVKTSRTTVEIRQQPALTDEHLAGLPADPASALAEMAQMVSTCSRCALANTRNHTVFGEGALNPKVLFVGEGPGADEDRQGRPFVGASGQLLDKIISAMKFNRQNDCYIANVVKCRPPNNATPIDPWKDACRGYLQRQIQYVNPRFIIALGATAATELAGPNGGVGSLRGRVLAYENFPMIVTYHPAALLHNPNLKRLVWEDVQIVMKRLEEQKT